MPSYGYRQSECLLARVTRRRLVQWSSEYGEEACMRVKLERPRPSENLKKCSTKGSTSNDVVIQSAACRVQSNNGQTYIGVGKLNGQPLYVL